MRSSGAAAAKPHTYLKCCVDFPTEGPEYDALVSMIDDAIDCTYRTFSKYVDVRWVARSLFSYELNSRSGLTLKDDRAVTYHRSQFKGKRCYFLCHSATEYIFVKQ